MKHFISLFVLTFVLASFASAQENADADLRQEARRQTESIRNGGRQWPVLVTKFFEIHYQRTTIPDSVACIELDAFVEKTLIQIDASGTTADDLRLQKLSYYLCDDATVEKLTGYRTRGMADLAGRAVISSHFPHFHELAHLLVDITISEPALQTHPLLLEGTACLLGGRWGRAPETILYTSWVHAHFGMGELGDVMTRDDFYSFGGGADVAYSLGAMLCEVVRRETGFGGVMQLYENLSGSVGFVASLTAQDVFSAVAEVCHWQDGEAQQKLETAMELAWPDYRRCGIAPAGLPTTESPARVVSLAGGQVKMWMQGEKFLLHVQSDIFPVYLVSPASGKIGTSSIFSEHLGEEPYQGQRYGLRCSPDDIALYDFATNELLATWVAGFTDEVGACDGPGSSLVFEIFGPAAGCAELLVAQGCRLIR